MKYVYGIVPSRRLGRSLGVSPIPFKVCSFSCIYCQLGKTTKLTIQRKEFFPLKEILEEVRIYTTKMPEDFDVITLVGEGEPTLYYPLAQLIKGIKKLTNKPVALITNGSLFFDKSVREEAKLADIVMPSLDAWDEKSFRLINRPVKDLNFEKFFGGLRAFREEYKGIFYLESMCIKNITDIEKLVLKIKELNPDKVFINTPKRPPTESWVEECDEKMIKELKNIFKVEKDPELPSYYYKTLEEDPQEAILNIIKRHPMTEEEIKKLIKDIGKELDFKIILRNPEIRKIEWEGKIFYRYKGIRFFEKDREGGFEIHQK